MIVSQIMACDGGVAGEGESEGHVARIYTNSCFVFQLKREVKSK
jgi:hypothetical protein